MPEHRCGRSGAQHVRMIDVGGAGDHRVRQRQHLATRPCATNAVAQLHRRVDQRLKIETIRQRRGQQQASFGDQIRIIERHLDAVNRARYSCH